MYRPVLPHNINSYHVTIWNIRITNIKPFIQIIKKGGHISWESLSSFILLFYPGIVSIWVGHVDFSNISGNVL